MDANNRLKDKTVAAWLRDKLMDRFERDAADPGVCVEDLVDLVEAIIGLDGHDDSVAQDMAATREFLDAVKKGGTD